MQAPIVRCLHLSTAHDAKLEHPTKREAPLVALHDEGEV